MAARAFVLINCSSGNENDVLSLIETLGDKHIVEAHVVYGLHDIITHIQGESMEEIQEEVIQKVRLFPHVRAMMTLPVVRE
ncbi:MAG: Lrp/AsnC ligand binding domain-containing protein [Candidatus Hodarchaeales archaeon]